MTATDTSGNVATFPSDAVGNVFAFNAAFPFGGFRGPIDFTRITKLDISFLHPETNTSAGNSTSVSTGAGRRRSAAPRPAQPAEPDGDRTDNRDRCSSRRRRFHGLVR